MSVKEFTRAGHFPTLIAALLYFDVSFMTWVMLGPLAPFLREELGLSSTQQGLFTAIPLLGGSLFRPMMGMLADRIGGRRTGRRITGTGCAVVAALGRAGQAGRRLFIPERIIRRRHGTRSVRLVLGPWALVLGPRC